MHSIHLRLIGLPTITLLGLSACVSSAPNAAPAAAPVQAYAGNLDLRGVHLWYTDTGGSGTPVILLLANTGTSANWESQNVAFSKAGYRVIAFDRRGWGRSIADPSTGPQPGTVADDLHSLVEKLQLGNFHLVGVAGGGGVALDYATWHPERLLSLVFSASTGSVHENEKEVSDLMARVQPPGIADWTPDFKELSVSYRRSNPEGVKKWIGIEERAQQKGAPSQPLRSPSTYAKLETIRTPTLVMPAEADYYAPPDLMKLLAAHIKDSQWAIVPDAGHSVAWEQPDIFNKNVLDFISKYQN
jgi:pimeloyl-ACP methyl ester carboxylesterase